MSPVSNSDNILLYIPLCERKSFHTFSSQKIATFFWMENKWAYIHELLNFEATFPEQVRSSGPIFRVLQRKAHYCVSSSARKERKEKPTKGVERRTRGRGRRRRHHGGGSCGSGVPHPPRFRSGDVDTAVPQRGPDRRLVLLPPVHRLPQVYVSTSAALI
jgi:hypothetical protein